MGHYVLEQELGQSGFRVHSQLQHYYRATCSCGHSSQAQPGFGYVSCVEGRVRDLKLTEYVDRRTLVGHPNCNSWSALPDESSQKTRISY